MITSPAQEILRRDSTSSASMLVPAAVIAQARKTPDAVALVSGAERLSYRDLDLRSNRVAQRLRSSGVSADVLVGLCLPRSFDFVTAALGIWKAGAAYVPLDPSYPLERLSFMLNDAQAPVVMTSDSCAHLLQHTTADIVNVSALEDDAVNPRIETRPGDLAYVIYTSGSTGTPKGVEITHGGLANLVAWHRQAFSVASTDRASHVAGLGFDASVWELWPYLESGASLHFPEEVTRGSAELLRDWILANRITIGFVPTPIAERIIFLEWPGQTSLRIMLTGGDALHHFPPAGLPFALINNYGPTECTVVATSGHVLPGDGNAPPSIGKPIANTRIHLLDEDLREVPIGTPGEIHVAGAGVARGYHNSPELTAQKFIPSPCGSGRLYKTGDLARQLPDGSYEFLGRIDDQIKIRGYRIEPREIIGALNAQPGIHDSVVMARADSCGEKRLIAYVAVAPDFKSTAAELRASIGASIPEYMIPATFVRVDDFPLTPNGKVDYSTLPEPDSANTLHDEVSSGPRTMTEKRIAEVIAGLLQLDEVGVDENFFMLGGHSLLGAQLIARLRKDFGVQIGLRALFAAPTVAELSSEVDRLAGGD